MGSILHIPAKTLSARCPGKNWADIQGKPSICWVIESALQSGMFSKIVVSTDGPEVREAILDYPVVLVSQNPSTVIQTTHDILQPTNYESQVTIMLPTVCLISPGDIEAAICKSMALSDPVMIVTRFPYRADEVLSLDDQGHVHRPFSHGPSWIHDDDPPYYIDAGALYTFPPRLFRQVSSMYVPCMRTYQIPRYRGVDMNEPEDLEMVRVLKGTKGDNRVD